MHKKTVIDFKELGVRQIFTDTIKELKTKDIKEVKHLLAEVEAYQNQGYYAVGYVSYEAAPAFETKFEVIDGPLMSEYLLYFTIHESVQTEPIPLTYKPITLPKTWQELTSAEEYRAAIEHIHHHIRQGDTYQVNYTVQLQQNITADPFAIYNRLVVEQNAHYNAFIQHDDVSIISVSPELFFKKDGDGLTTRPMKGTTNRGLTTETDLKQAQWLAQDQKNRSENMMIVDLLRNDMNRISKIGSENVKSLCLVEQYSTIWQMTSTIETQLLPNSSLGDIFQALFPCGSITGAPKIATMAIIKDVEKQARGVYCGAIGILLPNGPTIFNVAIRTLQMQGNKAIYGVGGGITWDSKWEAEYEETKQKSAVLYRQNPKFDLISTGRIHRGKLLFLKEHLNRLQESSRYFSYPFNKEEVQNQVEDLCQSLDFDTDYRLKMSLAKNGELTFEHNQLTGLADVFCQARLVEQTHPLDSPYTYFKTSYRPHISLEPHEQIYYNQKKELLETSIGNLVLKIEDQLYTPPVHLGLLNGIYRQSLIANNQVTERVLTLDNLKQAQAIYGCNAVRGLYELKVDI
ncbi:MULTISPECIES: aminodeoxychorismate synthase component I [Streptococcus]|jgi:para-aminobenzoate synthetase/4-amino-4-deoxychorismate lyase|uniref:aminodeoxychorismate synthase component I n=1 Tax=Streptococcus TaxID=1301 RepID=UPI000660FDED|nr:MULTISPECIES: aminodeoxychorismate synthase component I [Streptococcus]MCI5926862.1 aminodeoxychorismate synthase component I [Streptococcus vestibularis]MCY7043692.1 aminodeoxychorismate synthase component I [Streptococcus vestibularis]MDU3178407.1 aminodeoxychorismate synthase component I [Streptococcus vestibularis]